MVDCPICGVFMRAEGGPCTNPGLPRVPKWWICPICHGMFGLPTAAYTPLEIDYVMKQFKS
jgi:hypothetical protein